MKKKTTDTKLNYALSLGLGLTMMTACGDDPPGGENPEEVITTMILTFAPQSGTGGQVTATFRDLNPEDSTPPSQFDSITLQMDTTYELSIRFLNETEDPAEEITEEIEEESDEHQVFVDGASVGTLVSHAYADTEMDYKSDGRNLPVGLLNDITPLMMGSGSENFRVTLKHQPPENGVEVKTPTSDINDGETDIRVAFDLTVN